MILVTGATGNVGRAVVASLKQKEQPVRAAVLDVDAAREVLGGAVTAVPFDFGRPQTYSDAFAGVKKLFLMRPPAISDVEKYIKPVVDYAAAVGVQQIVFLSLMGVENKSYVPHYKVEECIKAAGVPYTFLRAGFFMQNLNTTHRPDIVEQDDIFVPAGSARTAFIDVWDIGAVAARVLTEPGHANRAYDLTGSETLTYNEVATIMSEELGRQITYSNPNPLRFAWRLRRRGYAWSYISVISLLYFTTRFGAAERVAADTAVLLDRTPTTMRQYVRHYAHFWQTDKTTKEKIKNDDDARIQPDRD